MIHECKVTTKEKVILIQDKETISTIDRIIRRENEKGYAERIGGRNIFIIAFCTDEEYPHYATGLSRQKTAAFEKHERINKEFGRIYDGMTNCMPFLNENKLEIKRCNNFIISVKKDEIPIVEQLEQNEPYLVLCSDNEMTISNFEAGMSYLKNQSGSFIKINGSRKDELLAKETEEEIIKKCMINMLDDSHYKNFELERQMEDMRSNAQKECDEFEEDDAFNMTETCVIANPESFKRADVSEGYLANPLYRKLVERLFELTGCKWYSITEYRNRTGSDVVNVYKDDYEEEAEESKEVEGDDDELPF